MFKNLALRFRMYKVMDDLNRYFNSGTDFITGEKLEELLSDPSNRLAVLALSAAGCIKLDYSDDEISSIGKAKNGTLYLLERSELWFNRIVSFIAGFLSAVAAGCIIKLL